MRSLNFKIEACKVLPFVLLAFIFSLIPCKTAYCQKPVPAEPRASTAVSPAEANILRTKEELRIVKSFARASFKKYLQRKVTEKTREMVFEIKDWSIDREKERFYIEYEVNFEILTDDFYGDEWITLRRTFFLNCDLDGKNANLKSNEEKLNFIFENILN